MTKYVVTAKDKLKRGLRFDISIPLTKIKAKNFIKRKQKENKIAIPKYRTLTHFKLRKKR